MPLLTNYPQGATPVARQALGGHGRATAAALLLLMLLRHRHARLHVHDRQRWPRPAQLQQLAQALASGRQGHERRHAQGLREGSARTRACVVVLNSAVRDTEQARAWLDLFGLHNPLARRLFNVCRMMPCTHLFVRQAPKNKQAHASAAQTLSTITVHRAICLSTRAHTHTHLLEPPHTQTHMYMQAGTHASRHTRTHTHTAPHSPQARCVCTHVRTCW